MVNLVLYCLYQGPITFFFSAESCISAGGGMVSPVEQSCNNGLPAAVRLLNPRREGCQGQDCVDTPVETLQCFWGCICSALTSPLPRLFPLSNWYTATMLFPESCCCGSVPPGEPPLLGWNLLGVACWQWAEPKGDRIKIRQASLLSCPVLSVTPLSSLFFQLCFSPPWQPHKN